MVKKELQDGEEKKEEVQVEYVYDSEFEKVKDQYAELQSVFERFQSIANSKYEQVGIVAAWRDEM